MTYSEKGRSCHVKLKDQSDLNRYNPKTHYQDAVLGPAETPTKRNTYEEHEAILKILKKRNDYANVKSKVTKDVLKVQTYDKKIK